MKEHSVHVMLARDGRVFLFAYSDAANGPSVSVGLPEVLPSIDDVARLGESLVRQLHESNRTIVPARNWRNDPPEREFVRWLGLKSFGQFMRGTRSVAIIAEFDDVIGEVEIAPERNGGTRGGFTPIDEERVRLAYSAPEQLGRAVQDAMTKATR